MTESATLQAKKDYFVGRFSAMASPCELLIETDNRSVAQQCLDIASNEAHRIEHKFSRYRDDNIIHQINTGHGKAISVDDETAALLDYADSCYQLSDGLFDITSGILRQAWQFDGRHGIPQQRQIDQLLPSIGWSKIDWHNPVIQLPAGMEIDMGGIGKEYAVDRVTSLLKNHTSVSILVNFGGDLAITHKRKNNDGWHIGVADPDHQQHEEKALHQYVLKQGAMATSGDAHRCIVDNGIRYGHILNPKTGWPETGSPRSVTVLANTCLEAGILSTLAILHGAGARQFLEEQHVPYWCN